MCSVKLEVNVQVMEPLVHITSAYVMQSLLDRRLVAHLLLLNRTAKIEVLKFRSFFVAPVLVLNRQRRRGDNAGCSPVPTTPIRLVPKYISTMFNPPRLFS